MLITLIGRLISRVRWHRLDSDLDDEIRGHLDMAAEAHERQGLSPAAARSAARREFGGIDQMKERHRDVRGFRWLDDLARDLKVGGRGLTRRPGFTAVTVLTLAIGVGATTTIFSVVDGVLLRPLAYEEPDRLVMVWGTSDDTAEGRTSPQNFVDWRTQTRVFESIAAWFTQGMTLTDGGPAERIEAARVTEEFFSVMRVAPDRGRVFGADEQRLGAERVALLHDGLWRRRYGADPDVIGTSVELDGDRFTIVGVMPPGFEFPTAADVWTPLVLDTTGGRHDHALQVVARLVPGATLASAQADMARVSAAISETHQSMLGWGSRVVPLQTQLVQNARPTLALLMTAVALVFLIACGNVANLLLVRASARRHEMAIRRAVGASRGRLIRQSLTESTLLAMLGGCVGLTATYWALDAIKVIAGPAVPLLDRVAIDVRVLGFTAGLTLLTSLLSGLAPALRLPQSGVGPAARSTGDASRFQRRRLPPLVTAEVALALTLLVAAGLLLESLARLGQVDPGFEAENLVTMRVGLDAAGYPEGRHATAFYSRLLEDLRSLPGVETAAIVSDLPIGGAFAGFFVARPGQAFFPSDGPPLSAAYHVVSPGYHEAMGIPLVEGRHLDARDTETAPFAVVISATMARRYWPDRDPVGQRLQIRLPDELGTIVGVVGDVSQGGLRREPQPAMYFAHRQAAAHPALAAHTESMWRQQAVALRTTSDSALVIRAATNRVHALDPRVPVFQARTMQSLRAVSIASTRLSTTLLSLFGMLATSLAAIGVYGVLSQAVTARRQEVGVRMALGATRRDIIRTVIARGLRPVWAGLGIGLAGATVLSRLLTGQLYGIDALHLPTYASVTALLAGCALAACVVPAFRAARIAPMSALRLE